MTQNSKKTTALVESERVQARQEYFFKYLQISPSYWLAHKKIALKEKISKQDLPKDFPEVLELYKIVGDVFSHTFDSWWHRNGQNIFAARKESEQVWLTLDMTKTKEDLLEDFSQLLDKLKQRQMRPNKNLIYLQTNKIRLTSLFQRHLLVTERAAFIENKTNKQKLWSIGKAVGIGSKWTKHVRLDSKRSLTNAPVRSYLSILVSKNLKDALILAENAARGKFPCLDPIETNLKFDFYNIKKIYDLQTSVMWSDVMAAKDDKRKYMSILDPSNSRRKIKKFDVGADLEVEHEALIDNTLQKITKPKRHATEYEELLEVEASMLNLRKQRKLL